MQADGEQQLKDLGVSVLITQAVDTRVAAGSIIRTDPAAGSQVAAGSTVVVYVSRPQVNTTAKVPALTGLKSVDDARSLLVQRTTGSGQHHRAVQRPACRYHHRPEPGGRFYR